MVFIFRYCSPWTPVGRNLNSHHLFFRIQYFIQRILNRTSDGDIIGKKPETFMEKHMKNVNSSGLCSIIRKFCTLLAFTAVCMAGVSVWNYLHIRPADQYTDQGIHRFEPYEVLPIQVKNTTGTSRDRRRRPTKTVYMLYYRATDGSGYQWSREVVSRTSGQKMIAEGTPVERRVLSITGENTYISTEAHLTAASYTSGLRRQCVIRFFICILYLSVYGVVWFCRKNL